MQFVTYLWLALMPLHSVAEVIIVRDPMAYSLKQYAFILALALVGGVVSWWGKVRKGELRRGDLAALVGEMTTSALAGLLTFYVCEYLRLDPLLTPAIVGIAGHMGTRGIQALERIVERRAKRLFGETDRAPLGKD